MKKRINIVLFAFGLLLCVLSYAREFTFGVYFSDGNEGLSFGQQATAEYRPLPPAFTPAAGGDIFFKDEDAVDAKGQGIERVGTDIKATADDNAWLLVNGDVDDILTFRLKSGSQPSVLSVAWIAENGNLAVQEVVDGTKLRLSPNTHYNFLQKPGYSIVADDLSKFGDDGASTTAYIALGAPAVFQIADGEMESGFIAMEVFPGTLNVGVNNHKGNKDWWLDVVDANGNVITPTMTLNAYSDEVALPLTVTITSANANTTNPAASNFELRYKFSSNPAAVETRRAVVWTRVKPFNVADGDIYCAYSEPNTLDVARLCTDAAGRAVTDFTIVGVRYMGDLEEYLQTAEDTLGGSLTFKGKVLTYTPPVNPESPIFSPLYSIRVKDNVLDVYDTAYITVSFSRNFELALSDDEPRCAMKVTTVDGAELSGLVVKLTNGSDGYITGVASSLGGPYATSLTTEGGKIKVVDGQLVYTPLIDKNYSLNVGTDEFYCRAQPSKDHARVWQDALCQVDVECSFEMQDLAVGAQNDVPLTIEAVCTDDMPAYITAVGLVGATKMSTSAKGQYGTVKVSGGKLIYTPNYKADLDGTQDVFCFQGVPNPEKLAKLPANALKLRGVGMVTVTNSISFACLDVDTIVAEDDIATEEIGAPIESYDGSQVVGYISGAALPNSAKFSSSVKGQYGTLKVKKGLMSYTANPTAPEGGIDEFVYKASLNKASKIAGTARIAFRVHKSFACGRIAIEAIDMGKTLVTPVLHPAALNGTVDEEQTLEESWALGIADTDVVPLPANTKFKTSLKLPKATVKISRGKLEITPLATAESGDEISFYYRASRNKKSKVSGEALVTVSFAKSFEGEDMEITAQDDATDFVLPVLRSTGKKAEEAAGQEILGGIVTGFRRVGEAKFKSSYTGEFGKLSFDKKTGRVKYVPNAKKLLANTDFNDEDVLSVAEPELECCVIRESRNKAEVVVSLQIVVNRNFLARDVKIFMPHPGAGKSATLPEGISLFEDASGADAEGTVQKVAATEEGKFSSSATLNSGSTIKYSKGSFVYKAASDEITGDVFAYSGIKSDSKITDVGQVELVFYQVAEDADDRLLPDYREASETPRPVTFYGSASDIQVEFDNVTNGVTPEMFRARECTGFLDGETVRIQDGDNVYFWCMPEAVE